MASNWKEIGKESLPGFQQAVFLLKRSELGLDFGDGTPRFWQRC